MYKLIVISSGEGACSARRRGGPEFSRWQQSTMLKQARGSLRRHLRCAARVRTAPPELVLDSFPATKLIDVTFFSTPRISAQKLSLRRNFYDPELASANPHKNTQPLFCISCAPSVDIPPACAVKLSLPKRFRVENHDSTRFKSTSPRFFLTRFIWDNPCSFFFTCTINTELTAFTFARTVTFAPTKTN